MFLFNDKKAKVAWLLLMDNKSYGKDCTKILKYFSELKNFTGQQVFNDMQNENKPTFHCS